MELFELRDNHAFPTAHVLLIEPFKTMWETDNSRNKEDVLKKFTFIELACSPKKSNPFHGIDDSERPAAVKKEVFGDPNYRIDSDIMAAGVKYMELLKNSSPSYSMYEATRVAAEELKKFLTSVDLTERTPSGTAVIKPRDVTGAMKEIPDIMKALELMRSAVQSELIEDAKTRNQREIGHFER